MLSYYAGQYSKTYITTSQCGPWSSIYLYDVKNFNATTYNVSIGLWMVKQYHVSKLIINYFYSSLRCRLSNVPARRYRVLMVPWTVVQRRPLPPHTKHASYCWPARPTTASQPTVYITTQHNTTRTCLSTTPVTFIHYIFFSCQP